MNRTLTVMGLVLLSALALSTRAVSAADACPISSDPPAALTSPAAPLEAVPAACGPQQQTGIETAGGSTCAMARQALHGELESVALCSVFCTKTFIDKECKVIQGGYSMSGSMRYTCSLGVVD